MTDFVSGLQKSEGPPVADPRGLALLERIRVYGTTGAAALDPICIHRFDGVEWLRPDPADIAAKDDCDAIVRLVELILADKHLCAMIAARLARAGGRPR